MSCKAPAKSSSPTNQHPVFLQAESPSCRPTNSVRGLNGNLYSHFLPRQNPERFVTFCYRLSEAVVQIGCYTSVPTSAKEVLFSSALICLSAEMKGSVKEPNMFHNYETEKMTRKASDVAENLQL